MVENLTSPKIHQNASAAPHPNKAMNSTSTLTTRQSGLARLGHIVAGALALVAAMATSSNLGLVQLLELKAYNLFFELRGPVATPDNIVILAIDDPSLSQEQYYRTNPQRYAYLEPLQAWPWKRTAYAKVIQRLMEAGASSVAVDVLFITPSSYGAADDKQLANVLQRYAGRVTLAAEYEDVETREGHLTSLNQPLALFWTKPISVGSTNFLLEPDGKVHRFASEFPLALAQKYQEQGSHSRAGVPPVERSGVSRGDLERNSLFSPAPELPRSRVLPLFQTIPSFDEAAVRAAKLTFSQPKGDHIYFYGPQGSFTQIPFWHVLDPDNWNTYLQRGKYFKDKIVLIGGTAASLQDFHRVPFSKSWLSSDSMSGVEIHANAIANLIQGHAIAQAIPNTKARGLSVLLLVLGAAVLLIRRKQGLNRFIWAIGISVTWGGISYLSFVYGQLILPTAVPVVAIALCGLSYLGTATAIDRLRKRHLVDMLERHVSSPVVQEIISQQYDLQDLLKERELAILGKVIGGRYTIVNLLASGGFSETYIAEDNQRPSRPLCVVKQLKLANNNSTHLQLARRLFKLEAATLEKLGWHSQIPRLFAYFEEEEFYLVQELIVGHPLKRELQPGKPILEPIVIQILQDLLQILEFVHSHDVIHRDIKPSNIIRRHSDGKLVLIDFGAVKEVTTQLLEHEGQTGFTIGIGTQGYTPNEQYAGRVKFSSDIYAVGMIGIKALTGLDPHELQVDSKTGEFLWTHKAQVSPYLAEILSKMVRYDFSQRYQSAAEARSALEEFVNSSTGSLTLDNSSTYTLSTEDLDAPTTVWEGVTTEIPEPPSSTFPSLKTDTTRQID